MAGWAATASFFIGIGIAALVDRLVPEPMYPHEGRTDPTGRRSNGWAC